MATNDPVNKPQTTTTLEDPTEWGSLNDLYKFKITLCDDTGTDLTDTLQIVGTCNEPELSIENQYSSPFDNSNPEQKMPTMMAMLQSGTLTETATTILGAAGFDVSADTKATMNQLKGRSNLTKVNSRQVFTGTQPVTLSTTLHFEAWKDAFKEVEQQLYLLQQWALPKKIGEDSLIANVAVEKTLESAFPTLIPPFVAIKFGGKRYAPMLILPVQIPLGGPFDSNGNRMFAQVGITFASLTAWDSEDIQRTYGRK